jgi:hypothetical protein
VRKESLLILLHVHRYTHEVIAYICTSVQTLLAHWVAQGIRGVECTPRAINGYEVHIVYVQGQCLGSALEIDEVHVIVEQTHREVGYIEAAYFYKERVVEGIHQVLQ